jgi:4-amino-4-deoxy-L-arabinose transferase-like glycosyltransferase
LFGSEALRVLRGDRLSLFGWTWFGHTAVFTYLEAGSMAVFGKNIMGLRVLPGVMSSLSLVFVYLLARRMFGVKLALVAASLFAFAPYRLLFSRLGIHDMVVLLLFFPATVYFIYRGLHSRRTFDYALGGISLGIGLWLDYNNKSMILIRAYQ